jgi:predicted nucleic acid-binding protein
VVYEDKLTDIVFTEILLGFRSDTEARLVEGHLKAFPMLRLDGLDDFALAAQLYRRARRAGVTIRKTLDCSGTGLQHRDRGESASWRSAQGAGAR